ncbi:MSHA pilin protein MshA [Candidatus Magnetomoraceae bacterium gMMP-15]
MKENLKKALRNKEGFTLIEIIVVLVILGILAAIIVPKYFDLEQDAGEKAAQGVVAELQTRANLAYATALMDPDTETKYEELEGEFTTDLGGYDINNGGDLQEDDNTIKVPGSAEEYPFTYTPPVFTGDDTHGPEFMMTTDD